jgi:hypothetical protein
MALADERDVGARVDAGSNRCKTFRACGLAALGRSGAGTGVFESARRGPELLALDRRSLATHAAQMASLQTTTALRECLWARATHLGIRL